MPRLPDVERCQVLAALSVSSWMPLLHPCLINSSPAIAEARSAASHHCALSALSQEWSLTPWGLARGCATSGV